MSLQTLETQFSRESITLSDEVLHDVAQGIIDRAPSKTGALKRSLRIVNDSGGVGVFSDAPYARRIKSWQ